MHHTCGHRRCIVDGNELEEEETLLVAGYHRKTYIEMNLAYSMNLIFSHNVDIQSHLSILKLMAKWTNEWMDRLFLPAQWIYKMSLLNSFRKMLWNSAHFFEHGVWKFIQISFRIEMLCR